MLKMNIVCIILLSGVLRYSEGKGEAILHTVVENVDGRENASYCDCFIQNITCSSHRLHCALQRANFTSNTIINIITDVELSSVMQLMDVNNISIIGHNNPTVDCNNTGALHFMSSHNITIKGIKWKRCGTVNNKNHRPGLEIYNCSDVIIKDSSFKFSAGRSLALVNILGQVSIDYCEFTQNKIHDDHGAAIYYSSLIDTENVLTINNCNFSNNRAKSAVYVHGKYGLTREFLHLNNSVFSYNQAIPLYAVDQHVWINGNVYFQGNSAENGGGIFLDHTELILSDDSNVTVSSNTAFQGSAFYITNTANITFKGRCMVMHNNAINVGAFYSTDHSTITFSEESIVSFLNNEARRGGAIYLHGGSTFTCKDNCKAHFKGNGAGIGGAIHTSNSNIIFTNLSNVSFNNNRAKFLGGAIHSTNNSYVKIQESCTVAFSLNRALFGGAMSATVNSYIVFQSKSMVRLFKNRATTAGGAIHLFRNSKTLFKGYSTIIIDHNLAIGGSAMNIFLRSSAEFLGNSTVLFDQNSAQYFGGAIQASLSSSVIFKGDINSNVTFNMNKAYFGGVFFINNSKIAFETKSVVKFNNNNGLNGGVMYLENVLITFNACIVSFINNSADCGGVFYNVNSNMTFTENSSVTFHKNTALMDGGVGYLTSGSILTFDNHCNVTFSSNIASDYGGVAYINLYGQIIINTTLISFQKNKAGLLENIFFINVPDSCNSTCVIDYIVDTTNQHLSQVTTSPHKLILHDPAKCIHSSDANECDSYYIKGIMLGQEITINGCILDYYNEPISEARLLDIRSDDGNYDVDGSDNILISCNRTFDGISITGSNNLSTITSNISMNLTLHFDRNSESRLISVSLTVELSPCHPGFVYDASLQKCVCYDGDDAVYCSDSISTIRRGYWFGSVNGKPTVARCPVNYCDFTCCEITNGIHYLSPMRKNQCGLNRNGIACGGCEEGYTLSFDSARCIQVEQCTTGHKVLIIISTITYWVGVLVVTFLLMHYQVGIAYLYAIIHYYSMLDILLTHTQNIYLSEGLYTAVSVVSSFAKLIPQFLGQLCLVENMDEIDQQFTHYVHPLAVSFILIIISLVAKRSYRISSLISKDIIRVICLLLLLSYTSVAITSLLILQPLKFFGIDEVYTQLSPDFMYFNGRHLVYGLVAISCTLVIVIGLPLLLSLEPFLNKKFSFVKIKPFLDQFQGCYKNEYRCFAGYYMICRLIIIVIIILSPYVDFPCHYILIILCINMALIHLIVKPYASNILNVFDGLILHMMIFIVSIIDPNDPHSSNTARGIVYITLIVPVILFCMMQLFVYRVKIKKIVTTVISRSRKNDIKTDVPSNSFDLVIGNTLRRSRDTTVCQM